MRLYTIGFTKTPARAFFERLSAARVRNVLDTRLNRVSQLSGFAKERDLAFFLDRIAGINYAVETLLAPTADILDAYRTKSIGWDEYARRYLDLLAARKVEARIDLAQLDGACLLCSEATPEHCHRRLAADYLAEAAVGLTVEHL